MLHLLFITLLSTTIISSLQCAESKLQCAESKLQCAESKLQCAESKKNGDGNHKKIKIFNRKSQRSLSTTNASSSIKSSDLIAQQPICSSVSAPHLTPKIHEHLFLTDIRNNNIERITQFHFNNHYLDFNMCCNEKKNTALHIAVINWHTMIIEELLKKPQVDPTKKNIDNKMPHYFIPKQNSQTKEDQLTIEKIKCILFKSSQIHLTTLEHCQYIISQKPHGDITPNEMKQTILDIKTKIKSTEEIQNKTSAVLPTENCFKIVDFNEKFTDQFFTYKVFQLLEQEKERIKQEQEKERIQLEHEIYLLEQEKKRIKQEQEKKQIQLKQAKKELQYNK